MDVEKLKKYLLNEMESRQSYLRKCRLDIHIETILHALSVGSFLDELYIKICRGDFD